LLATLVNMIESERGLEDLKNDADGTRQTIEARLGAREQHTKFSHQRDEAIFQATLSSGEGSAKNLQATRAKIEAALALIGLSPGSGEWVPDPSFSDPDKKEIAQGSYELLLALAEAVAQPLPR